MLKLWFRNFRPIFLKNSFQLQHFYCTYGYLLELVFAFIRFRNKGVRVLAGPFVRSKILWYAQNFQWAQNLIFPNGKHILPNSLINS